MDFYKAARPHRHRKKYSFGSLTFGNSRPIVGPKKSTPASQYGEFSMNYWVNGYQPETLDIARSDNALTKAYWNNQWAGKARSVCPGDIFICYGSNVIDPSTGRRFRSGFFFGYQRVLEPATQDLNSPFGEAYMTCFKVEQLQLITPIHRSVSLENAKTRVSAMPTNMGNYLRSGTNFTENEFQPDQICRMIDRLQASLSSN
jgi:hypothetical protein